MKIVLDPEQVRRKIGIDPKELEKIWRHQDKCEKISDPESAKFCSIRRRDRGWLEFSLMNASALNNYLKKLLLRMS